MPNSTAPTQTTSNLNQVMVWISTVTASLAVAGVGYVVSELNNHDNRLVAIEASRFSMKDGYDLRREQADQITALRNELQVLKDRVKDLEYGVPK